MEKKTKKAKVTKKVFSDVEITKKVDKFLELRNKVIKKINHPNRKIIAEKILSGVSEEELIEEYGSVKVAEIKRVISACKGKPWVCTHCG